MDHELVKQGAERLSKQHRRKRWWTGVVIMALIVLAGTVRLLTYSAAATNQAGDGIQLQDQWIKNITLSYTNNPGDWEVWSEVTSDMNVSGTDHLRFHISYIIPENTFDAQNTNTVIYQIPIENKIEKLKEQTGDIINPSTGGVIGTYSISEAGEMKMIFENSFLSSNKDSAINGKVAVEFAAGDVKKNQEGKIELPFSDRLEIHFPTIVIKENHSIQIQKHAQIMDKENGVILYTIQVSSINGTAGDISLSDVMGIRDANGTISDEIAQRLSEVAVTKNGKTQLEQVTTSLPATLPKLEAGEYYTITYKAQIQRELLDAYNILTINNRVKASFVDSNGQEYTAESSCDVRFEKVSFTKSNSAADGKIKWSIRINESKADISGWVLWDSMAKDVIGKVTITPDPVKHTGSSSIEFDEEGKYTFPQGSRETYTIVYETEEPLGDQIHVMNKATLTPPGGDPSETESHCYVNNNPIIKEGNMAPELDETDPEHKLAIIHWKVTIQPNNDIPEGWIYKDQLEGNQWFTWEQVKEAANSLNRIAQTKNFYAIDENGKQTDCEHLKENVKYKGFQATFSSKLPKGEAYVFSYESTADVGAGERNLTYKNTAFVNQISKEKTVTYESSKAEVTKYDTTGGTYDSEDSTHNYYELDNGRLSWRIETYLPQSAKGHEITLTEYLPEDLTLEELRVSFSGDASQVVFDMSKLKEAKADTQEVTLSGKTYQLSAQNMGEGIYDITIPKELAEYSASSNRAFLVDVAARIPDTYLWVQDEKNTYFYSGVFENKVAVTRKDAQKDIVIGEDSQKQTIQKDEKANMIQKSMISDKKGSTLVNNVLVYSLKINPDGKDLVKNSSTITFLDQLTYSNQNREKPISVALIPGSLKVYKMNKDGTEGEPLSLKDTPYTYEAAQDANKQNTCKITMTIPDGMPLVITYRYYVNCEKDTWISGSIVNTAKLLGTEIDYSHETTVGEFQYQESSATASKLGITMVKVDRNNNAITLAGAEFELSQYNKESQQYEKMQTFVTGEDGILSIASNSKNDITYNHAYRLIETKAPEGYLMDPTPRDFYIESTDTQTYPYVFPEDYKGKKYINGQQEYISNERCTTAIWVKKEWMDHDNRFTEADVDAIAFDLHQLDSTLPPASERCNVTLKYRNVEGEEETRVVQAMKGSQITLVVETKDDWFNYFSDQTKCVKLAISGAAMIASNNLEEVQQTSDINWHRRYTVELQVNGDAELTNFPALYPVNPTITGEVASDQESTPQDVIIGTYSVSKAEGWKWDSTTAGAGGSDLGLPSKSIQQDGKMHYYSYYIREQDGETYQVKYSTDVSGITFGTITMTNTVTKGYILPDTGGTGTMGYMFGGWTLIAAALSAMIYKLKKKFIQLEREGKQ